MANKDSTGVEKLIISYLTLRKAVGILGMTLPFILALGFLFIGKSCTFPPSISHFFYTGMGNYFVGILCAVSLFLFAYNGYSNTDKWVSKCAGLFAALVALFPTNFNNYADIACSRISGGENTLSNIIHYGSATLLFSCFAFFSLVLFTKTDKTGDINPEKKIRNSIYKACGWIIVFCIAGIAAYNFFPELPRLLKTYKPVFVLETIALLAFGYSWLIKGETFFRDKVPANSIKPAIAEEYTNT